MYLYSHDEYEGTPWHYDSDVTPFRCVLMVKNIIDYNDLSCSGGVLKYIKYRNYSQYYNHHSWPKQTINDPWWDDNKLVQLIVQDEYWQGLDQTRNYDDNVYHLPQLQQKIIHLNPRAGDMYCFWGNELFHSVSTVKGNCQRLAVVMTFHVTYTINYN